MALAGEHAGFPLLHHWRILPGAVAPSADLESAVEFWEGSPAVRARLEALQQSTSCIVLCLEHFPQTLGRWLGAEDAEAISRVERALIDAAAFMKSRGLAHFDAHFDNILTDGHRLYFSDFGLSLSMNFELAPPRGGLPREARQL